MDALRKRDGTLPADGEILSRIEQMAIEILNLAPDAFNGGLRPDDSLVTTLDLDSVTRLELLFAAEDEYGITIEIEDGVKMETVGDLIAVIRKCLSTEVPDGDVGNN